MTEINADDYTWTSVGGNDAEDMIFYRFPENDHVIHLSKHPDDWRLVDGDDNDLGPAPHTGPDDEGWYRWFKIL